MIADYDRRSFSVRQCLWDANAQSNIVAILPPSNGGKSNPSSPKKGSSSAHKTPIAAIVGGVVGGIVFIGLLATLYYFFIIKPRRKAATLRSPTGMDPILMLKPELESHSIGTDGRKRKSAVEMDGVPVVAHELVGDIAGAVHVPEMAAREEVAAEMSNVRSPVEMETTK